MSRTRRKQFKGFRSLGLQPLGLQPLGLLLALAGALLVLWQVWHWALTQARTEAVRKAEERLALYTSSIQGAVEKFQYLPFLLAEQPVIRQLLLHPDDPARQRAANEFLARANREARSEMLYVLNRHGTALAASNWAMSESLVGQSYPYRPYFIEAMQGQPGRFFAVGNTTGRPGYFLSSPVYDGERILGVATAKLGVEALQADWHRAGENVMISDANEVVILSSRPEWIYRTLRPLDAATRQRIDEQRQFADAALQPLGRWLTKGQFMLTSVQGQPLKQYLVTSQSLPQPGWRMHYLVEMQPLYQRARNATLVALALLALLGLLALWLRERQRTLVSRRRTQRLARESALRQRAMLNSTQAGLLMADTEGRVEYANPTAAQLLGRSPRELRGRNLSELFSQLPEPGQTLEVQARGAMSLPLEIAVNPLAHDRLRRCLVTLFDIRERKAFEQALQEANDRLEARVIERTRALEEAQAELIQAGKLAALGTMAAAIAHELNQPITAIRTYAASSRKMLARGWQDAVAENLQQMETLTQRMALITGQLKLFASKGPRQLGAVALQARLSFVLKLLQERLQQQGVELVVRQPEAPVLLWADEIRVEQILTNLLRNALDALKETPRPRLEVTLTQRQGYGEIQVRDNGPGLTQAVLDKLFDPFFTTKEVGEGLGLGLSITYGIVQDLNGQISATNHADGGACFQVRLPLAEAMRNTEHYAHTD